MQTLGKKVILFACPFLFIFLLNLIVDPFALHSKINKYRSTAKSYDERLWKLNQFATQPTPYIILGDSRAGLLSEKLIQEITQTPYVKLAVSGAPLIEIIDVFWFTTQCIDLKKVFIGINFDRFNDWQTGSGVEQAIAAINNPLLYCYT